MTDADQLALLIIFLCLLGSMFFSGSETAITAFGERRAKKVLEEGGRDGRLIKRWVEQPVRVLSTILVGNNITNTLMGATATALAIRNLEGGKYADWAVPIAVVAVTALLLLFGEITPKAIGRMYSRRVTMPALRILNVLDRLMYPVVWIMSRSTDAIIELVTDEEHTKDNKVTADELEFLAQLGSEEGGIPEEQARLLQNVFDFEEKIVADIMVPQGRMTAVDLSWHVDRIKDTAIRSGHSRIPVYQDDLDNVVGILHIKDLVGKEGDASASVRDIMRPPLFVSDSLLIQDLLRRFKEMRMHLAVVVDDGGHTVGIVTLEDVIEQIVGQIFDETDRAPDRMTDTVGLRYVDGQTSLTKLEDVYDVEFEEIAGVSSVGDLLTYMAGQVPIPGSVFVLEGLRFKVLAADVKHIIRVSVQQIETEDDED